MSTKYFCYIVNEGSFKLKISMCDVAYMLNVKSIEVSTKFDFFMSNLNIFHQ